MVLDKFRGVRLLEKSENSTLSKGRKQISKKPRLQVLSNPQPQTRKIRVQDLTDQELIACCVQNSTSNIYWTEFYRRFNHLIDKRILKTLHKIGIPYNAITQDIADEISFSLMEKIHGRKLLEKALNHPNFPAWLVTVVRNVVLDWNITQRRQKNSCAYAVEMGKKSLYEPFSDDEGSSCLMDKIAAPEDIRLLDDRFQRVQYRVHNILQAVENLPGIQRLVFKVSVMFYNSLEEEDIQEIALMRSVAPSRIRKEVNTILNSLVKKNEHYEHHQNMITIKFAFLERLHHKFYEMEKNLNSSSNKLKELKKEIAENTKQLENLRYVTQKINVYPTAEEVAQLLGMPKAKQKNIGVWLHRARKSLKQIEL
jgi:DNA-directed RNA polymerase specialized sigma24 family protein